ncbi:MAG: hypothetical protein JWN32_2398, partial [Solirubrobacterales bacterium]|nr:hypothetical protein [Solirubrobacterales bacterium]
TPAPAAIEFYARAFGATGDPDELAARTVAAGATGVAPSPTSPTACARGGSPIRSATTG